MALGWPWGGLEVALGGFGWSFAPISTFCFLLTILTRVLLWAALPRLSRLDVGCSTFDVRCSGPRTVPVRSGSEWAWMSDLLPPSCPGGRREPGRFAVRSRA